MARKMKDSGIEWIGEIPEGWEVCRLKNIVACHDELRKPISADKRENHLKLYDYYGASGVIDTIDDYNVDGTVLLIGEDGANLKLRNLPLIYRASGKFWVNNHAHILIVNKKYSYDYVAYLLEAGDYSNYITGSAQPKLSQFNLMRFPVAIPNYAEQENISFFINRDCSKIDSMLFKTRSSIEEYKKLKQAVISQAVTKGVRGEREMKDSGVEWIGEIPKEFDSVQLKFFCKLITDGTHFSPVTVENGLPYITAGDVHGIGLDYNSAKRISEEDFQLLVAQGCQPLKGDVLLVKDGATTGRVGFVDSDTPCVILSSVAMLRPADNTDGHYLMYLLASDFLQKQILVSMAGSAMPRTTLTKLTKYIGLLPSLHEQKEIADYLDAKCAEIDGLIVKKEQLVKELESYKKSLIYEVVTGKREV
mgnify:CR=1 FL=1